jgi:hypothetical protein
MQVRLRRPDALVAEQPLRENDVSGRPPHLVGGGVPELVELPSAAGRPALDNLPPAMKARLLERPQPVCLREQQILVWRALLAVDVQVQAFAQILVLERHQRLLAAFAVQKPDDAAHAVEIPNSQ